MLMASGFYIDIDRDDNYESNYSYKDMINHVKDIIYGTETEESIFSKEEPYVYRRFKAV